jgi:uncharacterized OB-fold protein
MGNVRVSLESSVLKIGNQTEEDALIGSRCRECGRYFFPQRKWCGHCAEPTTEVVELSKEGTISSYSLMTRKQNSCLVETPYFLGEVMMPEGILIYTVLNAKNEKEVKMGQKARFGTTEIKKDEKGNSVMAYWFTPVK